MSRPAFGRGAFLAGAAAAVMGGAPRRAAAQAQKLRVGSTASDSFAEAFYADATGAFTKNGLDVEIVQLANKLPQMTAVLGGTLDIGLVDAVSLGTAITKGIPFVVIGGGGLYRAQAPTSALCVARDSPIKTAADLIGKNLVVLGLHDLTEISTWAWLERNGVKPEQLKYAEMTAPQVGPALLRGAVDAGYIAEPFLAATKDTTLRVLTYVYDEIAPEFCVSHWFTTRSWAAANVALVKRFLAAIYDTARWANAHPDESAPVLAEAAHFPLTTITRMTRSVYATALDPRQLDPVFAAMSKFGIIDRRLTTADVALKGV